jgi:hypothetical protein
LRPSFTQRVRRVFRHLIDLAPNDRLGIQLKINDLKILGVKS